MIHGIDVSYAQCGALRKDGTRPNRIDWPAAHADGVAFAIIRATYGTRTDSGWRAQREAAAKVDGLQLGAYHCLSPASVVSPRAQADAFVAAIGDTDGYLLMLDVERVCAGRGSDVRAFAERLAELRPTHPLLLYAPAWWWAIIDNPKAADLGPLVQSHYVGVADEDAAYPWRLLWRRVPTGWWSVTHGGWTRASLLQFTSNAKVDGYPNRVDAMAFDGTREQLASLARDTLEVGMKLTNITAAIGTAQLTKPWGVWPVATDIKTDELPAGTILATVGRCTYHGDKPGFLVSYQGELCILPAGAEVGLTWTPRPFSNAETLAIREAEYARLQSTAAATIAWPAPPRETP